MIKYLLALCAAALPFTAVLAAENSLYVGVSAHLGTYDESGIPKLKPRGVKLEFGKYLISNLAVEAHVGFGTSDDSANYQNVDLELELDNFLSLFLKGDIDLGEKANLYGLVGFTKGKLDATASATIYGGISGGTYEASESADDSGFSYGVGIESEFDPGVVLSAEYIMYLSEDDYDYSGINLGIAKKF